MTAATSIRCQYDVSKLGEVRQDAYEAALRLELAEQFPGAEIDLAAGPGKTVLVTVEDDHLSKKETATLIWIKAFAIYRRCRRIRRESAQGWPCRTAGT
jgi:hypothetical protein